MAAGLSTILAVAALALTSNDGPGKEIGQAIPSKGFAH